MQQIADLLGVSVPFIHDVELGRREMPSRHAKGWARALAWTDDKLLHAIGHCSQCRGTGRVAKRVA
jgi:DNA-binding transcriptional regulator YdaS (Cro superfamily)